MGKSQAHVSTTIIYHTHNSPHPPPPHPPPPTVFSVLLKLWVLKCICAHVSLYIKGHQYIQLCAFRTNSLMFNFSGLTGKHMKTACMSNVHLQRLHIRNLEKKILSFTAGRTIMSEIPIDRTPIRQCLCSTLEAKEVFEVIRSLGCQDIALLEQ